MHASSGFKSQRRDQTRGEGKLKKKKTQRTWELKGNGRRTEKKNITEKRVKEKEKAVRTQMVKVKETSREKGR